MTVNAWKNLETAFHAGLRIIAGSLPFAKLATQSQTDMTTRAALAIAPLKTIVATRRLGLLRRVLASGCPLLLGFILEARSTHRTWGARFIQDIEWLQAREPGAHVPLIAFVEQVQNCAVKWKARLKTATQGESLTRATQEDLAQLESFQKEAFGILGIPVGHKEEALLWPLSFVKHVLPLQAIHEDAPCRHAQAFAPQSHLRNRIAL